MLLQILYIHSKGKKLAAGCMRSEKQHILRKNPQYPNQSAEVNKELKLAVQKHLIYFLITLRQFARKNGKN